MGNSKSKKAKVFTGITHKEKLYVEKSNIDLKFRRKVYNVVCDKNESFSSTFEKIQNRIGMKDENLNFISDRKTLNSEMKLIKYVPKEKLYVEKSNITLKFRGKVYNVVCDKNESFSSIFEKIKNRIGMKDENLNFISDGKKLNSKMKLNKINFNTIMVDETEVIQGGDYAMNFTDVSKQVHEEHYFSAKAPSYRIVTKGINIYGICKGKNCIAYKKEVVVRQRGIQKFDLIKEKDNLECPKCGGVIIPKTLGFHLCKYKVSGKKYSNNMIEPFEFEGKAENQNSIQYFNPDKNGETMLVELIIEVQYL